MNLSEVIRPAKSGNVNGKRGFVFAAEVSDETHKKLEAIRTKARGEGSILANVALAEMAIAELYTAYVEGGTTE